MSALYVFMCILRASILYRLPLELRDWMLYVGGEQGADRYHPRRAEGAEKGGYCDWPQVRQHVRTYDGAGRAAWEAIWARCR